MKNVTKSATLTLKEIDVKGDLRSGQRIPGSRYFRAYCLRCKCPMRVTETKLDTGSMCRDCDPDPSRLASSPATVDDLSPWQENAIRAMEEG